MTDLRALAERVITIVEEAGTEILAVYRAPFDVATKSDASPLTAADTSSHRVITAGLAKLTPDVPVLSEESDAPGFDARRTWSRYWLVDPLDGTKEFVSRNGEFTVNVALIENHRPVLGIVGVPALGALYLGIVPERHAEKRAQGATQALRGRSMSGAGALTVVASRSHGGERLEQFLGALATRFSDVQRTPLGSSLKLCVLAEGAADLYPRLGPTSEWDIAAAQAVLEAAGGAVWTLDRKPLAYNTKESLLNPEFIAVGDGAFPWWDQLPPVP